MVRQPLFIAAIATQAITPGINKKPGTMWEKHMVPGLIA